MNIPTAGVQRSTLSGFVYFIQSGERPLVKIGWALDPHQRLRGLQCGNPDELRIIATSSGSMHLELAWRKRFAHLAVRSEWFALDAELATAIADATAFGATLELPTYPPPVRQNGSWNRLLNEESVRAIRRDQRTVRSVAAEYGVSKTCVQDIRMGRTWKHV